MRRIIIVLMVLLYLVGCGSKEPVQIFYTNGTTKNGISKIDHKTSKLQKDDFIIIDADDSSNTFYEIGYCKKYELLLVTFDNSFDTYIYEEFSEDDWNDFRNASSLGSWYNNRIKNKYRCYYW